MAKNLRTALLTTAVASGLLLSSAPVEAQILEEKTETTQGTVTEDVQEPTVPVPENAAEEPSPAAAPDLGVAVAENSGTVGPEAAEDMTTVETLVPVEAADLDESSVETASGDFVGEGAEGSSVVGISTVQEASSAGLPNVETSASPVNPGGAVPEITAPVQGLQSSSTSSENASESPQASAGESQSRLSFEEFVNSVEMPAGSENWTEKQWNDYLETPVGQQFTDDLLIGLAETEEFKVIDEIVGDFIVTGNDEYLDELMDYLLGMFDGNGEWAQEVFAGIMDALGMEEETEHGPTPAPTFAAETPTPEIKPAGTVTNPVLGKKPTVKPVLDKKPIAKAVLKPVVNSRTGDLAETGSSDVLIYAGAGAAMLLLGAVALRMRRKPRAH